MNQIKPIFSAKHTTALNAAGIPSRSAPSQWLNFAANASGSHLDLYIYGVIGGYDWATDDWQDSEQVIAHLNKFSDIETITVHINSLGGYVQEGLAILNTLRKHPAAITVEIDAFALSIASVIMLAADTGKVRMARNAHLMIHNVSTGAWGNANDLRKEADIAERLEQSILEEYAAKTGKPAEDFKPLLDEETWFSAEEALEMGLIDEIMEPVDIDAAADAISVNIWQNMKDAELKHMPQDVQAQMVRRLSPSAGRHAQPLASSAGAPQEPAGNSQQPTTVIGMSPGDVQLPSSAAPMNNHLPTGFDEVAERERLQNELKQKEQTRRNEVRAVFDNFGGVTGAYAAVATEALEDMDCSPAHAREMLLNAIGNQSVAGTGGSVSGDFNNGRVTTDEHDTRIDQAVNAMLARGGRAQLNQGNPFAHMTLMDMAKASLNSAGVNHAGLTPMDIAGRAMNAYQTTADFPVILERTISEAVLIEYNRVGTTWRNISAVGSVTDFRDHDRVSVGSIGTLDDRTEAGEFKNKAVPDGEKEQIRAGTKGNIISITREAIINDDMGYFMNESRMIGNAAGLTIEQMVYALLASNPKMKDGYALFHAKHNNLQTGAAMGEASLDKMAIAMGSQKGVGDSPAELAIDPSILLVPRVKKIQAKKWMSSEFIPTSDGNRPESNGVQGLADVVAPSHVKSGYYLFADPNMAPVIEVVFLNGVEEPYIEVKDGWRTDGAEMKVRLDFGVGVTGYRGAQFNPGA